MQHAVWGKHLRNLSSAWRSWGLSLAASGLLLGSTACGPKKVPPCEKSELLTVQFEPYPALNQDREGNPRSVVVRVFQLEGDESFRLATFEELWVTGGKAAASVVGGPDELIIVPGVRETRSLKRNPKATHIAMTANFREHHPESEWKATLELPKADDPCRKDAPKVAAMVTAELANYALRLR